MSTRSAAWLAWSLAALSIVMFVASIAFFVLTRAAQAEAPSSLVTSRSIIDLLVSVPFLAFPLVGALIASRRPRNPIGWICLAVGLLWMLLGLFDFYGVYGLAKPDTVPFPVVIYALVQWLWLPTVGLFAVYLLLLFPDGRLPSRRWRPLAWFSGLVIALLAVDSVLAPGELTDLEGVRNPFGLEGASWLVDAEIVLLLLFVACILASAASLVLRYRHSGGEVRQQIKWMALAGSVVGLLLSTVLGLIIVAEVIRGSGDITPLWLQGLLFVMLLSFAGVPVAIGFAVLKYRLYEIDIIINRALVYVSLTATSVALYLGGVVLLQRLFVLLTGQRSTLAVVASTLLIAALFNPLRRRIQSFVDRRFYRRKYDAVRTLEAFNARLRDETELETLSSDVVGVVRETMQPAHVSLWLRSDPDNYR
ncbi:MAG: hypothetical protein M3151_13105 [Actinomycetota bacterium]|nr:hypothetical protein [Actinomycetota bacterium]